MDNPEKGLVRPGVRPEAPLGPAQGPLQLRLDQFDGSGETNAYVEGHGDIGRQLFLDPDRVLGCELDLGTVVDRAESGTTLLDHRLQGKDLKTAGIGEDGPVPCHEPMEPAKSSNPG